MTAVHCLTARPKHGLPVQDQSILLVGGWLKTELEKCAIHQYAARPRAGDVVPASAETSVSRV